MTDPGIGRRSFLRAGALLGALAVAGCTATPPDSEATASASATGTAGVPDATFTFATAARPAGLDPFLATDTESHRVTRQILEGLVGVDPLTSAPVPLLAESWTQSEDGRTYTFKLRRDITFHDGEPLNADAVCANFDRWYNLPASTRGSGLLAYEAVFNAYSDSPALAVYKSSTAVDEYTVSVELATRLASFIPALASPEFAISSPKALQQFGADALTTDNGGQRISDYATRPVGTGPFAFDSWNGDEVRLAAYPQYWGERGRIGTLVFKVMTSPASRLRALKAGEVDGYDLVTVSDVDDLARNGMQILQRDPYSVLYLGINQAFPGLDDIKMRQAIAHSIDKAALLDGLFLNGTKQANQFVPEKLGVSSGSVTSYGYDPERAAELLEEAGYDGAELPFHYPRHVTRAYLPTPERVYAELSRQLTAVGLNIKPVPVEWSDDYVQSVQRGGDRALHLFGISGTFDDPDNFVGTLFGSYTEEFAYDDAQLLSKLDRARTLESGAEQTEAYTAISDRISTRVPAVPLAFPISALAFSPRVASYPTSPCSTRSSTGSSCAKRNYPQDRTPAGRM
ncbi:ABC transporter substrate-binding protein [Arthrobacter sp. ATA002]|uniref:ABC transporter substrate-binding protein n=1 Tax=Arthrobacter sp. ATA002 TaxID=2991715 RepID=UPI0022A6D874|nr:ABC transporter substrate-binding protein [Arthrobacter sp. ATA002]WAP52852.1 ABC transporter substrate-binding protein [Arthrobacter sp. ATA002]